MASLFNDEIKGQLTEIFKGLKHEVKITLFTQKGPCLGCPETEEFLEEIAGLSAKIKLETRNYPEDQADVVKYNIEMAPSFVMLDHTGKYPGIKFNGLPAGHEINSFIYALMNVSGNGEELPEDVKAELAKVKSKVNIKVFVTPGCPHCPGAVSKAHRLAMENDWIDAEMIEATSFGELSNKYRVSSVPKIVINETYELIGNQPVESFLEAIAKTQTTQS